MRRVVRCGGAALLLTLVATVGFASDLLIFASGERRSGALASCDDERCQLDGAPVPLADLLWIGLGIGGGDEEPPRADASPGAILVDGSLTAGKIVGLSQGTVVLDTTELERSAVRWLRIAAVQPPVDVLVRRDGALRTGALQGCAAGSCTMAGVAATRAELAWVGLAVSPEAIVLPSSPQDPAKDLTQFADGSTRVTPLVGVGAGNVVLGIGTFPRAEIAWIYLAPPVAEGGPPVIRDPPGQSPPSPPPPGPPGPPGPAPPFPPAGGPPPAQGGLGETGALWIGSLHERQVTRPGTGASNDRSSLFSLRLREVHVNPLWIQLSGKWQKVGLSIGLLNEGSTVTTQETFNSGSTRCWGQGSLAMDTPGPAGHLYLKSRDVDVTSSLGYDIPLEGGRYVFATFASGDYSYPMTCITEGRTTSGEYHNFYYPVIWVSHLNPDFDPAGHVDPEARGLVQGRMQGSFSATDGFRDLAVSWMLCREGDACPPPPELPPVPPAGGEEEPPSDCDETRGDRAQLDLKMDQWRSYIAAMEIVAAEFGRLTNQAAQWEGDYEHAMRDCNLWDLAQVLIGLGTSGLVPGQPKVFSELVAFFDMVDKVSSGDPSWLLPNTNLEFRAREFISLEDAWDIFSLGYSNLGQSSPQALEARLRGCGANTLDAVLDGAYQYLRLLEEIKPVGDRMHELLNNARDKEEDVLDFCLSHPKACEDYERCR